MNKNLVESNFEIKFFEYALSILIILEEQQNSADDIL
jgi:hypothetical protein